MFIIKYFATIKLSAREKTSGGVAFLCCSALLRAAYLVPLVFFWRSLFSRGVNVGMTLPQMLTYTWLSSLLDEQLNVRTPASDWLGGDFFLAACKRPTSILGDFAAQTVGGWVQMLVLFSLPMAVLAPLFGVRLIPASGWFFVSLPLTVSLGFAFDFLFSCLILRLKNATWLAHSIRSAIMYLFSGAFIPFALMPFGLGNVLQAFPFGSLAGAPLAIFAGIQKPAGVIPLQVLWNLLLWPLTAFVFRKSRERMVSYGG